MEQQAKSDNIWDHGSDDRFLSYYAQESLSGRAHERFRSIRDAILRIRGKAWASRQLSVADVGCGAGTQSLLWAELGHRVHGLDVNQPLLDLAQRRATQKGYDVEFILGSAVSLPWPDESMDACIAVELLEHVADWNACLRQFIRVLRPGGVLFVTTTNRLCPVQQEFTLPAYSWYPAPVKRYCERLAVTTKPQWASYATYPATNWFTFFQLRHVLNELGLDSMDRFDLVNTSSQGRLGKAVVATIRRFPPLRWAAHVVTPGTLVLAVKR
jgi:2-polyprenyl-6-hydroxyphenyl methylase/3-demethylubiquinone-9 3-methyltransferase